SQEYTFEETGVINAPVSIFPTPFPKKAFQDALQVQPLFNQLVQDIADDDAFLHEIMERQDGMKIYSHYSFIYLYWYNHQQGLSLCYIDLTLLFYFILLYFYFIFY